MLFCNLSCLIDIMCHLKYRRAQVAFSSREVSITDYRLLGAFCLFTFDKTVGLTKTSLSSTGTNIFISQLFNLFFSGSLLIWLCPRCQLPGHVSRPAIVFGKAWLFTFSLFLYYLLHQLWDYHHSGWSGSVFRHYLFQPPHPLSKS